MEARGRTATGGSEKKGTGGVLLTLVVPTRNEAENVAELVRKLREGLAGVDYRIVFVDDSTDGTPGVIRGLAEEDGRVTLLHREGAEREGGLSTAVTTGMEIFSGGSEFTCVMDADLQHPPEKVREMLEVARSGGADVVVASRYAKGGSYEGLSGWTRRAVSLGSKSLARVVFKEARKTTDPMTGFFLVRNEAISGIQFRPTGFKVLLEILVCAPELRVAEVPFGFKARNAGVSKASLRQGLEYLTHILSLFWYVPSAGRFWKFALVGASGVVVNSLVLVTLAEVFDAHKVIAWMFAVGLSILSNFLLNNAFTWRDVRHSSRIHFLLRGALAYPVAVMGIGANFAVFYPLLKYVSAREPRPRRPFEEHRRAGTPRAEGRPRPPRDRPRPRPPRRRPRRPRRGGAGRDPARHGDRPANPHGHGPPAPPPGPHQCPLGQLPSRPHTPGRPPRRRRLRHPPLHRTLHRGRPALAHRLHQHRGTNFWLTSLAPRPSSRPNFANRPLPLDSPVPF